MLDIINIYNFVLIRGATLSTNALVMESNVLIAVCNQMMVLPCNPNFPWGCSPKMAHYGNIVVFQSYT
jgi:hypothetical protein